jgi:two-component system chemotaxis response regulator CheY
MALGRILVVDDEADVRKSVRFCLNKAGYDTVEAENGAEAIAQMTSGDNPLMVDAIVCDLNMPKVCGEEAISYFRTQFPSVPVLVLTGYPDTAGAADLYRRGVSDYLTKPVESYKLAAAVDRLARNHVYADPFTV